MTAWNPGLGYHKGVTAEQYFGLPALSSTAIRAAVRGASISIAHMRYAMDNPKPSSASMRLGWLTDAVILGTPDAVWAVAPDVDKRTKAGKQAHDEFLAACDPRAVIVTADDLALAKAMREACMAHREARALLSLGDGDAQAVSVWREPTTGLRAKARFDRFVSGRIAIDLKTTRSADPHWFARSAGQFGYHQQVAWYIDGFAATTGDVTPFTLIAVESEPPHGVAVYTLHQDDIAAGAARNTAVCKAFAAAQNAGVYPGYPGGVHELEMPKWALGELNNGLTPEDDGEHPF